MVLVGGGMALVPYGMVRCGTVWYSTVYHGRMPMS